MAFRIFTILVRESGETEAELNACRLPVPGPYPFRSHAHEPQHALVAGKQAHGSNPPHRRQHSFTMDGGKIVGDENDNLANRILGLHFLHLL